MEEFKANRARYISGAIGGAILVLILGFAVGPLTTSGSAALLASAAGIDRDVAYCVAHGKKLMASGKVPVTTNYWERTRLARALFEELLPDEEVTRTAIGRCSRAFPGARADNNETYWLDGVPRNSNR